MLKLEICELVFRGFPEGFIFILASYAFARKDIEKNRYVMSSLLLAVIGYFVRKLPIHFGVHTILIMMIHILLTVTINKIEVKKAISAVLSSAIIMFLSEGLNVLLLDKLFNIKIENVANELNLKLLYSMPSLGTFAIIIFILYRVLNKTKRG